MKPEIPRAVLLVLLGFGGICACLGLYYLLDTVWNGSFVEWFMRHYMITHEVYSVDVGKMIIAREPMWPQLKGLLLAVLIAVVLTCIFIAFASAQIYAKVRVRKSVTAVSGMIHNFMEDKGKSGDIFPQEYAEISVQMAEIRSAMQRHEQRQREEAARKNDLIAYLAHDLRTPLTSVIGYLSLLEEAADMPEDQRRKYIHIALDKARRLEELNGEFFEITHYNLQQMELEKKPIDLYYMLCQMVDEFYPLLRAHGNRALLQAEENLTVYGDADKLARVFNNILKNAVAYSFPDTNIVIWAEAADNRLRLHFRNEGPTIPPQKLASVFEKFVRLDESRSSHTGGAGLGLAIAREIVALHGGEITVCSTDGVTVFCVILPLS